MTVTAPLHMAARRGIPLTPDTLQGAAPRLTSADLAEWPSDGEWKDVLSAPVRPAVIEICGATHLPPGQRVAPVKLAGRLLGRVPRAEALVHATALCGQTGHVSQSFHISRPGIWSSFVLPALLCVVALAVILFSVAARNSTAPRDLPLFGQAGYAMPATLPAGLVDSIEANITELRARIAQMEASAERTLNPDDLFEASFVQSLAETERRMNSLQDELARMDEMGQLEGGALGELEAVRDAARLRLEEAQQHAQDIRRQLRNGTLMLLGTPDTETALRTIEERLQELSAEQERAEAAFDAMSRDGVPPDFDRRAEIENLLGELQSTFDDIENKAAEGPSDAFLAAINARKSEIAQDIARLQAEIANLVPIRDGRAAVASGNAGGVESWLTLGWVVFGIGLALGLVLLAVAARLVVAGISRRGAVVMLRWSDTGDGQVLQVRGPRYGKAPGRILLHGTVLWG